MIMTIDEVKEALKKTTEDKYQIGDTAYILQKALKEGWLVKVIVFGRGVIRPTNRARIYL